MKRRTFVALFALLFSANTLDAQSIAESNGNAVSEAGNATAISTSQAQGMAQAAGGAIIEGFNHSFTFESSDPAPYMPGTIGAPVLGPTLFNFMGRPAPVNGIPILANNLFPVSCRDAETGKSRSTRIIYTGAKVPMKADAEDERKIFFDFSGQSYGELVGSITIQSKKNKGNEVDVPTLIYDATQYIADRDDLKGYNVTLLTLPQGISYAMGVDSKGKGFSMSPVLSGLIDGPAGVLAGMASGFAGSKGVTVPTGLVGCTFLVLIESDQQKYHDLMASYGKGFNGNGEGDGNGNGKKRYEAVQEEGH
ncbi:hypothetical protein [Prosthecochloris sp. HL-130-GSB]|jgi:hypothetical protein|uniref:hypothetical protein n=1 Tax=Prosthecochloris sp. HL-130-GSB TaxID=1974213 RepID=UPI0012F4EBE4|nr:hypothetical protein [Prosthecochloris sp. HL-130-GSB]